MKKGVIISIIIGILIVAIILFIFRNNFIEKDVYNVKELNEKVKINLEDEFNQTRKLEECKEMDLSCSWIGETDLRVMAYLPPNRIAEIKRGKDYGISFAVKNLLNETTKFNYELSFIPEPSCEISEEEALSFIIRGHKGFFDISPEELDIDIIVFKISEDASKCNLKYSIDVKKASGEYYGRFVFIVEIK